MARNNDFKILYEEASAERDALALELKEAKKGIYGDEDVPAVRKHREAHAVKPRHEKQHLARSIYIRTGHTDLRKSVRGLSSIMGD